MDHVYDSEVSNGLYEGDAGAIYLAHCGPTQLHPFYINNRIWLHSCDVTFMNGTYIDTSSDVTGITLEGCSYSSFSDIYIHYTGSSAYSNPAILLTTEGAANYCLHNSFSNILAGRGVGVGTNRWTYAIDEADANQDYNNYSNINGSDCTTATLRRQGVNSKYDVNTIIGTVIGLSENSGTSTGTGARQTIAHGLIGTPNRVYFSDIEAGANAYQDLAADAANIYPLAVINQDYVWEAKIV